MKQKIDFVKKYVKRLSKLQTHPAPGFSCNSASTTIELEICSSRFLAKIDKRMSEKYNNLLSLSSKGDAPRLKKEQITWIKKRNKECVPINDNVDALKNCIWSKTFNRIYAMGK